MENLNLSHEESDNHIRINRIQQIAKMAELANDLQTRSELPKQPTATPSERKFQDDLDMYMDEIAKYGHTVTDPGPIPEPKYNRRLDDPRPDEK